MRLLFVLFFVLLAKAQMVASELYKLTDEDICKKAKEDVAKAWPWNPMREGEIIQIVNNDQSFVYCSSGDGKVTVKTDEVVIVVPFSKVHAVHRFRIDKEYYHKCFSAFVNRRILYYKKEREKAAKQEQHNR